MTVPLQAISPKKGKIVPLEASDISTFAFIGNVKQVCSCNSIHEYITSNIKLNVSLTDIQELNIKSDMKAFKVTIPQKDLQTLISSDWPMGIKVERFDPSKFKSHVPKGSLSHLTKNGRNQNHQKKIRKPFRKQKGYYRGNKQPVWSSQFPSNRSNYTYRPEQQQEYQRDYQQVFPNYYQRQDYGY